MGFGEARHLLSRTSFGATPAEIRRLEALPFDAGVDQLLSTTRRRAISPAPAWANDPLALPRHGDATREKKEERPEAETREGNAERRPVPEQGLELRDWWVEEMLVTDQPLIEKMTLFWHGHFTSSLRKVRHAPALLAQNALFRREALGNFATLLEAVARDPAMLIYLDGARNVAGRPNENFARELLELFTLGEGHYSEADVRNAARAFTGWSIDRRDGRFVNRDRQHDAGEKIFLGRRGRFTGDDILAILLRHPRTAETIVEKLWREFVSLKPERSEVQRLAALFRMHGYEMKPLLRAIFLAPAFREPANRGALIKSPVELVAGTVHLLGLPVPDRTPLVRMMAGLGQSLFDPPNVKGWPGGESWITTSTLLLRQQVLHRMIGATMVWSPDVGMMHADAQLPWMRQLPVEGRSLRAVPDEVRLGPGLAGIDPATLVRTLLPHEPIDAVDTAGRPPGAVVAAAMLDPAYQLK
jgi:uncharacterized protein (DUF1800 family)